jgi:hypothetical protein
MQLAEKLDWKGLNKWKIMKNFEKTPAISQLRHSSGLINANDLLHTSISSIYTGYVEHKPLSGIV